jgi:hypothetical protein
MCKDKLSLSFSGVHHGRRFQSSTQSGVPLPGLASEITGGWVVDPRAAGELSGYDPGFPGVLPTPANRSRRGCGSGIREGVGPGERVLTYLALNRRQAILSFLPPSVSSFTRLPGPTPFSDPFLGVWLDSISGGVVPETKS